MEKNLEQVMDEIVARPNVIGCLFTDQQGLCLGSKGNVSTDAPGIVGAIVDQAAKLEPNSKPPIVSFSNDTHTCIIEKSGKITGAIYMNI